MIDKYQEHHQQQAHQLGTFDESSQQLIQQSSGMGKNRNGISQNTYGGGGTTVINRDKIVFNNIATSGQKNQSLQNSPQGNNFVNINNYASSQNSTGFNSITQSYEGSPVMKKSGPKQVLNKFQGQNTNMNFKNNNTLQNYSQNYKHFRGGGSSNQPDNQVHSFEPRHITNTFENRAKNQKLVQNRFQSPSPSHSIQNQYQGQNNSHLFQGQGLQGNQGLQGGQGGQQQQSAQINSSSHAEQQRQNQEIQNLCRNPSLDKISKKADRPYGAAHQTSSNCKNKQRPPREYQMILELDDELSFTSRMHIQVHTQRSKKKKKNEKNNQLQQYGNLDGHVGGGSHVNSKQSPGGDSSNGYQNKVKGQGWSSNTRNARDGAV